MPQCSALLLLLAVSLWCCADADRRVVCTAQRSRETQAHSGALRWHADGRVSSTVVSLNDQRAVVEWLSAEGTVVAQVSTPALAADSGVGYLMGAAAYNDGLAIITASLASDGGVIRTLLLAGLDGGTKDVELTQSCTDCSIAALKLYEVNTRFVIEERGGDETIITSFDHDGLQLAQLRDERNSQFVFTPHAIVRLPGPRVYTPELTLLSVEPPAAPESVVSSSVSATVDLDHHAAELVSLVGNELRHQRFTFEGGLTPATRLGTALLVSSTAPQSAGTGIAFVDEGADDTGALTTSQWFAFVDSTGVKRGPDVQLAGDFTLGPIFSSSLLVASAPSRFTFFFSSAGLLSAQEIHCD